MMEILQLKNQPGDFGEKDPIKGQSFNADVWESGEEPTFVPTHNDNFKPRVVVKPA